MHEAPLNVSLSVVHLRPRALLLRLTQPAQHGLPGSSSTRSHHLALPAACWASSSSCRHVVVLTYGAAAGAAGGAV
jgi:hypothetical protein